MHTKYGRTSQERGTEMKRPATSGMHAEPPEPIRMGRQPRLLEKVNVSSKKPIKAVLILARFNMIRDTGHAIRQIGQGTNRQINVHQRDVANLSISEAQHRKCSETGAKTIQSETHRKSQHKSTKHVHLSPQHLRAH